MPRAPVSRPVVSPRLRILLAALLAVFGLLAVNSFYLGLVTFLEWWQQRGIEDHFYQLMFLFHLVVGLALIVPAVVFITSHLRRAWHRPNRNAVRAGLGLLVAIVRAPAQRAAAGALRFLQRAQPRRARGGLLGACRRARALRVAVRAAPPGRTAHPLAQRLPYRRPRGGGGRRAGAVPGSRPARRSRRRQRRRAVCPVTDADRHRRPDPCARADDGRLLRRVSCRCACAMEPQRASLRLVQQPRIPLLGAQHAGCPCRPRRGYQRRPLLRRLPRSGPAALRRPRRPGLRRCARSHRQGGDHLYRMPCGDFSRQPARQRRLHHRRAAALSLRLQRERRCCAGSTASWSRPSRTSTSRPFSSRCTAAPSSAAPATRCTCPRR